MKREELLKSKEYWIGKIQLNLFELIEDFMKNNNLSRLEFAKKLGVTKGYVSQILNGEFDHRISKFVELTLAVGKVPNFKFDDLKQFIIDDMKKISENNLIPFQIEPLKIPIKDEITLSDNKISQVNYDFSKDTKFYIFKINNYGKAKVSI